MRKGKVVGGARRVRMKVKVEGGTKKVRIKVKVVGGVRRERMNEKEVKVRALEQDDDDYDGWRSPLQGFNSVVDSSPPGLNQHSSASVAKVPKSYIPRSITPPPSLPKCKFYYFPCAHCLNRRKWKEWKGREKKRKGRNPVIWIEGWEKKGKGVGGIHFPPLFSKLEFWKGNGSPPFPSHSFSFPSPYFHPLPFSCILLGSIFPLFFQNWSFEREMDLLLSPPILSPSLPPTSIPFLSLVSCYPSKQIVACCLVHTTMILNHGTIVHLAAVKKSESEPEDTKPHIRASSIPRPRAVVSSPDNDQLFGNQKLKLQRPSSASKRHNLLQSRQLEGRYTQMSTTSKKHLLAQSKQSEGHCTRTNATASKKPLRNNKYEETAHKSDVKAKKGSAVDVRVPITNITKAKPCFMNT
ncbi:ABC transporter G family member 53 [Bienertia sinuspersici]